MTTSRKWILWDDQPIDSLVTTVIGRDDDKDELTYSLEPVMNIYGGETSLPPPLPFYIDNHTGQVFVNESLKDKVSSNKVQRRRKFLYLSLFREVKEFFSPWSSPTVIFHQKQKS